MHHWLTTALSELGLAEGDVVLVHSSLSGLGWIEGGPAAVIDALLAAVGESGTVMFPTLTGAKTNDPEHPPTIELATTPAQDWVGIIPETARQRPDARRSIHPTHSVVALGANREVWTQGHELGDSPCDEASPYYRLMDRGGKILLLGGVTHESNTSLHCIEEIAGVPYHLQEQRANGVVVMPSGEEVIVRNHLHLWRNRYSHRNLVRDFSTVAEPLTRGGIQQQRSIGDSVTTLIDAAGMREVLLPILARDPLALLTQN